MLALLLVAASVGLSNFAGAIGIGAAGIDARTRLRVGLVFGCFETGMPIIGLLIGGDLAGHLGHAARWLGAALLMGVGIYGLVSSVRQGRAARADRPDGASQTGASQTGASQPGASPAPVGETAPVGPGSGRLMLTGLALSIDNLVVGFALGTSQRGILLGALVIGAVSVLLALIGLELGARIGSWAPRRGEQIGGVILISVGFAVAAGALS
jgi:putative Mn2+ efflux pump MntP